MQSQKRQNDLCLFPRQTILSLSLSLSIYIYIYIPPPPPVLVLCCCMGFSLSCHQWRVFSSGTRASYCGGFSCGAWSVDFSSCGSQALEHRLNNVVHGVSCSSVCRIFPDSGSNLCLVHWQVDSLLWATWEAQECVFLYRSNSSCNYYLGMQLFVYITLVQDYKFLEGRDKSFYIQEVLDT